MAAYFKTIATPENWHGPKAIASTGIIDNLLLYGITIFLLDVMLRYSNSDLPFDERTRWWVRGIAYGLGIVMLAYVRGVSNATFIYFQF
jgi:hypothetical protein